MRLIRGLHNLHAMPKGCVATIGNFDGVHLGHRVIIDQVKRKAQSLNTLAAVIIFEPQPQEHFCGTKAPARLMRFREKLLALRQLDVDVLVCMPFNARVRKLSASQFVDDVLIAGLGVKHLVVGDDFRFGAGRCGDFRLLESMGREAGFTVEHTPTVLYTGKEAMPASPDEAALCNHRISSTLVRSALQEGRFKLVEELLGRPYSITGCVVHGNKLGRQIGVPTANVSLGRLKPALSGVYAVQVGVLKPASASGALDAGAMDETVNKRLFGVANLGTRPTVDGAAYSLEVHLFDFEENVYGCHISVAFCEKIREERKFTGLDALKDQICSDIKTAKGFFGLA